jgi:hypothetical protein
MKKSAFLKKFGFFSESYELLLEIKAELTEELKHPKHPLKSLRKAMFKVCRD